MGRYGDVGMWGTEMWGDVRTFPCMQPRVITSHGLHSMMIRGDRRVIIKG